MGVVEKWVVSVKKKVGSRQIPRLPRGIQLLVFEAIDDLTKEGPRPLGWDVKKLEGNRFRLRLKREYRMVYYVYRGIITIEIVFAGHRKDAQKHY